MQRVPRGGLSGALSGERVRGGLLGEESLVALALLALLASHAVLAFPLFLLVVCMAFCQAVCATATACPETTLSTAPTPAAGHGSAAAVEALIPQHCTAH